MADCPLADDCPRFSERIAGMGCQHYGDRGGAEWCNEYNMPISDLKQQPVKPGEEVVVEVDDIHESGAGVGRTEDGFIVMVDGLLPPARAVVRIDRVKQNHAKAKHVVERLPDEEESEEGVDGADVVAADDAGDEPESRRERLGSRDNFWGS
ncbi:TRAM domain-containing protein [Halobaculum lipolyticum]|uniref:TRAM domain-containing protein n=1 Tax=Halobaculum lipolyticum TaxID=3032001 RepID=A0ABD5WHL2_9EURY|nr:TRAM domain-containing protein [Halobaculum sp. DT31]